MEANSGSKTEVNGFRVNRLERSPELVSTMQGRGQQNRGDFDWLDLARAEKSEWGNLVFQDSPIHEEKLVDLAVAGDLCCGGHRWSNGDLRPLHMWKPAGALPLGNSGIVGLHQFLFGILDRVCGLQQ